MRAGAKLLIVFSVVAGVAACNGGGASGGSQATQGTSKPLVFFSQANSADPWRQVQDAETKAAAAKHSDQFDFEEQTAGDDPSKQIDQIQTEMVKNPKVMIVSPATTAVQQAVEAAHDKGVYVVVSDRDMPGQKWDVYVGGDNHAIGYAAGDYMGKKMNGKGTILMIQGIADAIPTKDRAGGFMEAMQKYPGIKIIKGNNCDYQRAKARTYMENFLQSNTPFDAVYAHNDEMAIGAYLAMEDRHTPSKMIVGIDGCQMEMMNMIKDGKIAATFAYPDPGPKCIEIASDELNGKPSPTKKVTLATTEITKDTVDAYIAAHPDLAK